MLSVLCDRGAAEWLSFRGIRSMLCAALLHDAGHFPFAHSLKELPLAPHEELSGRLIRAEPVASIIANAGGDPGFTAAIVDAAIDVNGDSEILFYRKLLSGSLDPDKLDYLNRDARYCGVPYGTQDIDFIFSMLHPHPERGVDIDERGIPGMESILFSKYMMYRSVYWHRSVRCATAMVKKPLLEGLIQGFLSAQDLYNLSDMGLFSLMKRMLERGHPLFAIGESAYEGQMFALAAEFPFYELGGLTQQELNDIIKRPIHEKNLARALSLETGMDINADVLIIDVPEPFSFETGLFVRGRNCRFNESQSFFAGETTNACAKTLRVVRVFIDRDVYNGNAELFRASLNRVFSSAIHG
jgi:hypothetical protein